MSRASASSIGIAVLAFVAATALAFFVSQSLSDSADIDDAMPPLDPEIALVIPVAFEGDPAAAATSIAEQVSASREIASELGISLEESPDTAGASGVAPITGTSESSAGTEVPVGDDGDPAAGGTEPPPPGPSPAIETLSDPCIDGGDECPDGVSGTILAIRATPEFGGQAVFDPRTPETRVYSSEPVCDPRDTAAGTAHFGVATSRPAGINMEYRTAEWRSSEGAVPWTSVRIVTDNDAEIPWNEWLADDTASDSDPRSWIQHCFSIEGLAPRDDYEARFTYSDKYDASVTATNYVRLVRFSVTGADGLVPGAQRRPTTIIPLGVDQLFVGMTREPGQTVAVAARQSDDVGACDVAGIESGIYSGDDTIRGRLTTETDIDSDVLNDPSYPYFPEHSVSDVYRLDLNEGTDYVVCIYWLGEGPSFDSQITEISEAFSVSTPEAYRPRYILHGLTNLFGEVDTVVVDVDRCVPQAFDLSDGSVATDRAGVRQTVIEPIELCTLDTRLNDVNRRGIKVTTSVVGSDGERYQHANYIRTSLTCSTAPCLIRLPEMAVVALPRVPADESDCGSGFGTGCLSDGLRSAGDAMIEIQFDSSAMSSAAGWLIGEPTPDVSGERELSEYPAVDVNIDFQGGPEGGSALVKVVADRPVNLNVDIFDADDDAACVLGTPGGFATDELRMEHTFTIDGLCLSHFYRWRISALDSGLGEATIYAGRDVGRDGLVDNMITVFVPALLIYADMSATIAAPSSSLGSTVYSRLVRTQYDGRYGPDGAGLGWTWPREDRESARGGGWSLFGVDGQANACAVGESRPLTVHARRTGTGVPIRSHTWIGQDGLTVTAVFDIYQNRVVGGPYGECVPGMLIESVTLSARLTIDELIEGVTLVSDSGLVEFSIKIRSYRPELVG